MRRLLACLLIFCVGLSIPAVGGPVCLCVASLVSAVTDQPECCDDCSDDSEDRGPSCCLKLDRLPEAPAPEPMPMVPAVPTRDVGTGTVALPEPVFRTSIVAVIRDGHIRGPTSASGRRAVLAIWRL